MAPCHSGFWSLSPALQDLAVIELPPPQLPLQAPAGGGTRSDSAPDASLSQGDRRPVECQS